MYRLTIKIGRPGRQYEIRDLEAEDLISALRLAIEAFPADAGNAELLELRRLTDPDRREYVPE